MSIVSVDNIQPIGSGTTVTVNKSVTLESGNTNITGVCTATSFSGSGANLTSHLTITNGNLVIGTAGQGIDFSAQTATSVSGTTVTSELLDHYEEGSWTPILTSGFTFVTLTARYTKIGNVVYIYLNLYRNDAGTYSGDLAVTNLPFSRGNYTSSMGLGLASSYGGSTNRKTGIIDSSNSDTVKVIKSGTTANVSYDNFVDNSRGLVMKWWYYTD